MVRLYLGVNSIQFVDHHLIDAKIRDKSKALLQVQRHCVSVGSDLPLWIDARTMVLNEIAVVAQRAIRPDGQHAQAAAGEGHLPPKAIAPAPIYQQLALVLDQLGFTDKVASS